MFCNKTNKRLRKEIEDQKEIIEDLRSKYEDLQNTTEHQRKTNNDLEKKIEDLRTKNEDLRTKNENLRTKNEYLRSKYEDQQRTKGYQWETRNDLKKTNAHLRTKNKFLLRRYEDDQKTKECQWEVNNDLEKTIDDLRRREEDLRMDRDHLLAQLECPVCLEPCLPPIAICRNGHNVCSSCVRPRKGCPTCRDPKTPTIRNRFAETVSAQYGGRCENKPYGCEMFVLARDKPEHQLDCKYRYKCRICYGYYGDLPGLLRHSASQHSAIYSVGTKWEGTISGDIGMNYRLISCFGSLFSCDFHRSYLGFTIAARYFGPRKNAVKYKCAFEFVSADGEFKCAHVIRCQELHINHACLVDMDNYNKLKREDGTVSCKIAVLVSNDE